MKIEVDNPQTGHRVQKTGHVELTDEALMKSHALTEPMGIFRCDDGEVIFPSDFSWFCGKVIEFGESDNNALTNKFFGGAYFRENVMRNL